ncbi:MULTISPECIES: thermonuclease family protein [Roseovarius]|uniref:Thermonuclease family protein n=2 Tax=Roseovarius TaxID=74030 RepID=A0ABZ2HGI0_9RHOB|nr:thermonuclease family protein [Roseovarius sp. W115]MDV2928799.1 thermonuclease family protein [Roseovarius sp. W115]
MEGAVLLLLLLIGAVATAYKMCGDFGEKTAPREEPATTEDLPKLRAPGRHATFDPQSAKPVTKARVIKGRAYIVDGDTVVIQKTQIRLFGVDAPEMNHPYGIKAKWALVALCKGHTIRAEVTEIDHYGRTVARCYLEDGRDLSAEMVKCGLAIDWAKYSGGCYRRLEVPDARKKMWLADARQKGRMFVWEQFEAKQRTRNANQ